MKPTYFSVLIAGPAYEREWVGRFDVKARGIGFARIQATRIAQEAGGHVESVVAKTHRNREAIRRGAHWKTLQFMEEAA